jgi:hypothetical protein
MENQLLTKGYKLFGQYAAYGEMDAYERWVDDGYEMGDQIGDGRPYEVKVTIVGGGVKNIFEVVHESRVRVDVYIFETEYDRQVYLKMEERR